MHIASVPATVPVSSRLSPLQVWQKLLIYLLEHHYGLTLNDTPFHDDAAIAKHIDAGITLADAVNFLVERYELVRIGNAVNLLMTILICSHSILVTSG